MGVSFGRARVADLAFQVFGKAIHPEWFTIRSHRRIRQAQWEADIRIIEGGHFLQFRFENLHLSEVLSGPETSLPDLGLLFHSPIRNERTITLRPGLRLEYQTCHEVERVDPEVFAHLTEEMTLDARSGEKLFHQFRSGNRLSPAPLSHLYIDARVRGLSIQTFHTFPDEWAIVRTQSLFETHLVPSIENPQIS